MVLSGIGAAKGLAVGPAVLLLDLPPIDRKTVAHVDEKAEKERLTSAFDRARLELQELENRLSSELKGIISAQSLFLEDPELWTQIEARLADGKNAEWAVDESIEEFAQSLATLEDPYLRERAVDIRDLGKRVLAALMNLPAPGIELTHPAILIAKDLTPSNTAGLDPSLVLGFATEQGGPTSHSAIMARAAGFPAMVGVTGLLSSVKEGDIVVIDATTGEIIINPSDEVRSIYENKVEENHRMLQKQKKQKDLPPITHDGRQIELVANIGGLKDVSTALEWGAEGVGLFRTEFLYMQKNSLPDEEEQYGAYKAVLERFAPAPVIFRTLDIGGDKALPYLEMPVEENPFLGYRAIRLCLDRQDLFKPQLRAILRASIHGKARIMFPMVATLHEFRQAKELLQETANELGITELPEVGIMVEIPSAALMVKAFAKEVDFFSIGSNDLIQYTMAADRGNKAVSYLYQHLEPAVLLLVAKVIESAHEAGKWVGMCGEMAGDPEAIPFLLGLGLDEFSMSASALPRARELIRSLSFAECKELATRALACYDVAEVRHLVQQPAS
ncbi:MAG: phosphoenolpyruvate--protein phosphotransferase [Desulfitobacteriaceae bacterium]